MRFTALQVKQLIAALPGCTDRRKQKLLPKIFDEWGRIDLEEHFSWATPQAIRAGRRNLKQLARRARDLVTASKRIPCHHWSALARQLEELKAGAKLPPRSRERIREAAQRLRENFAEIQSLAAEADALAKQFKLGGRLRHDTLLRYLVMLDLAAIFEWATGIRAARRIRTDAHDDAGANYGPFWDFASAAWPTVFATTKGLSNAVRFRADTSRKYGEQSAFIGNLNLRHPEWRIYDV